VGSFKDLSIHGDRQRQAPFLYYVMINQAITFVERLNFVTKSILAETVRKNPYFIYPRYSTEIPTFYQNDLAMRNTIHVSGGILNTIRLLNTIYV
jgi:hypothetical protein